MLRYWPSDDEIIRARFEGFSWRHESLLIARIRPGWSNSGDNNFDFVAEPGTKDFDFMRAGDDSIDASCHTQFRQSQDLMIDLIGNSCFAKHAFIRTGQ